MRVRLKYSLVVKGRWFVALDGQGPPLPSLQGGSYHTGGPQAFVLFVLVELEQESIIWLQEDAHGVYTVGSDALQHCGIAVMQ